MTEIGRQHLTGFAENSRVQTHLNDSLIYLDIHIIFKSTDIIHEIF
jgi:hypothetical protein